MKSGGFGLAWMKTRSRSVLPGARFGPGPGARGDGGAAALLQERGMRAQPPGIERERRERESEAAERGRASGTIEIQRGRDRSGCRGTEGLGRESAGEKRRGTPGTRG